MKKKRKLRFEVKDEETIEQCLKRMQNEGYKPVRRIEKPVFKVEKTKGKATYVPVKQQIIFEGVLTKDEH